MASAIKGTVMETTNKEPLLWIFWHPHQKLWNWKLLYYIRRVIPITIINKAICLVVIYLDTFILFMRAIATRVFSIGLSKIFYKVYVPDDISIIYIDLGTHKDGEELSFMVNEILPQVCNSYEAYGFEASQESFKQVATKFANKAHVHLINKALVNNIPIGGKIKLYKDMKIGIGDSIYRQTAKYEEVEALRLSDFLLENHLLEDNKIVLMRMNIEGAEYDVIQDLIGNNLFNYIDGYFGMWDDIIKIDIKMDAEFRVLLSKYQIHNFTFNGRDMSRYILFRRKCIKYHIHTRIIEGIGRLKRVSA